MFNPNTIARPNGNIFGFPYNYEEAEIVLIPVCWDATTSYSDGTANAPEVILEASLQLDFYHPDIPNAWEIPIFMLPIEAHQVEENKRLRQLAVKYINWLENGDLEKDKAEFSQYLTQINQGSKENNQWVYEQAKKGLEEGKLMGVLGGEHSSPLGLMRALGEKYDSFGILQIDAHADLRKAYEDFTYSHASIMYNVLKEVKAAEQLVAVGIRDICQEEVDFINRTEQIQVFYDWDIKETVHFKRKKTWDQLCEEIIKNLPPNVYISFDIDGLDPKLCPNTGTPVPGGLDFYEAIYLVKKLVASGRKIIGFDLCEVGDAEWDANVGARVLFQLCVLANKRYSSRV